MLTAICYTKTSNWDLKLTQEGMLMAIPTDEALKKGAKSSYFGDKHHVRKLMDQGYFEPNDHIFTEEGLELFSGLNSNLIYDDNGKFKFSILRFN